MLPVTKPPEHIVSMHRFIAFQLDIYFMYENHLYYLSVDDGDCLGHSKCCDCRVVNVRADPEMYPEELQAACKIMTKLVNNGVNLIDGLNMILDENE